MVKFRLSFPTKLYMPSTFLLTCHMPCPSYPPSFDHSNCTWRRVKLFVSSLLLSVWELQMIQAVMFSFKCHTKMKRQVWGKWDSGVIHGPKTTDVFVHYPHIKVHTLQGLYHIPRWAIAFRRLSAIVLVMNHWLNCSFRAPGIWSKPYTSQTTNDVRV
jgi:hypothetical protein